MKITVSADYKNVRNGLHKVAMELLNHPDKEFVIVGTVSTKAVEQQFEDGIRAGTTLKLELTAVEALVGEEAREAHRLLHEAYERRVPPQMKQTELPGIDEETPNGAEPPEAMVEEHQVEEDEDDEIPELDFELGADGVYLPAPRPVRLLTDGGATVRAGDNGREGES